MKKKFFSLLLVAAGLLCSGMVWAENVAKIGDTPYGTLQEAVNVASSDQVTDIYLIGNESLTKSVLVYDKKINLHMGTHQITSTTATCIVLLKGQLTIDGEEGAAITTSMSNSSCRAISVYGAQTSEKQSAANFSTLTVGKNVNVSGYRGVYVDVVYYARTTYYISGYATVTDAYAYLGGINTGGKETPGWDVNGQYFGWTAYGVTVNLNCNVTGYKYGIQLSGNIKPKPAVGESDALYPHFTIGSNAVIDAHNGKVGSDDYGTGIYAAGWGVWNIQGTISGCNGIFAKSGDIEVNGATVTSTADEYNASVGDKNGTISGATGGGNAITIESAGKGYAGGTSLTITGDTKVTASENGYALEETITNSTTTSTVSSITIESGTFIASEGNTIVITDETKTNDVVSVVGGSFTDEAVINQGLVGTNTIVTGTNDGEHDVFVIGTKPETTPWIHTLAGATSGSYVDFDASSVSEDITTTVECAYLRMTKKDRTITIKNGGVLKVGECVITDVNNAKIVVEAGGKLVVTGDKGIIVPSPEYLVVKAGGTLLFKPTVGSNMSPYATLEYVAVNAKSTSAVENEWDIIVSPFAKITKMTNDVATKPLYSGRSGSWVKYFDANTNAWVQVSSWNELYEKAKPFGALAITNATISGGAKYTFEGKLQGNITGKFSLKKGFNYMGNSFMAPMDVETLFNSLGDKVKTLVYIWDAARQIYVPYNSRELEDLEDVSAMTFFVLEALEDVDVDLDYTNLIWNNNK